MVLWQLHGFKPSCYMSFGSNLGKSDLILKDSIKIPSAEEYVILGVTIDNRLTFYNHLKNLCKKITNKLNVRTRIAPYLNHNQIRLTQLIFFLRDSLANVLLYGHFVPGVQIILLTHFRGYRKGTLAWNGLINFKNEH